METSISEWLANAINASGLSQAELSRKSGVSAAHITKVLNGERGLGETALRSIAEALHIPPEQAFRDVGFLPPVPAKTEQSEQLLYLFNQLDPDKKQELINFANYLLLKK
jgi:transcriptional regulator with XRE-family HTH domain